MVAKTVSPVHRNSTLDEDSKSLSPVLKTVEQADDTEARSSEAAQRTKGQSTPSRASSTQQEVTSLFGPSPLSLKSRSRLFEDSERSRGPGTSPAVPLHCILSNIPNIPLLEETSAMGGWASAQSGVGDSFAGGHQRDYLFGRKMDEASNPFRDGGHDLGFNESSRFGHLTDGFSERSNLFLSEDTMSGSFLY